LSIHFNVQDAVNKDSCVVNSSKAVS